MNGSQIMISSQDCTNNNNGLMSPPGKSRIPQPKIVTSLSRDGSRDSPGSPKMPSSPMSLSRASSREDMQPWGGSGVHVERWKNRFHESDRKYKTLLAKNEKHLRDYNDLERKYQQLWERNEAIENQLLEKEGKLNKLRTVSEKVYKEYDQLKNQYDVETQAMHKAIQSAGQWYQQNRRLKRKSAALMQKLPPQTIQDLESQDATDAASESSGGEELDGLRETVAELSAEVARLQTELNAIKLQEFEATETNVNIAQELENEKLKRFEAEEKLQEAIEETERNKRLARHLATEVSSLREQLQGYKNQTTDMKREVESAKKERDVMAHRSAIYLDGIPDFSQIDPSNPQLNSNNQNELMMKHNALLQELENLRTELSQERLNHAKEVDELHEKLIDQESSNDMFILEEKLTLAEDDLKKALDRAEKAEKVLEDMKNRRKSILNRVTMFENGQNLNSHNGEETLVEENIPGEMFPPSCPPPPPPPPPPPMMLAKPFKCEGKSTTSAITDMANILGLKQTNPEKKKPSGGAIDDIINQIKGGRFHLKSTEQKAVEKKPKEEPAALKEMLNILGTLRRKSKNKGDRDSVDGKKKSIF